MRLPSISIAQLLEHHKLMLKKETSCLKCNLTTSKTKEMTIITTFTISLSEVSQFMNMIITMFITITTRMIIRVKGIPLVGIMKAIVHLSSMEVSMDIVPLITSAILMEVKTIEVESILVSKMLLVLMIAMGMVLFADGMAMHAFATESTNILRIRTGLMKVPIINIAQDMLMVMRVETIVI